MMIKMTAVMIVAIGMIMMIAMTMMMAILLEVRHHKFPDFNLNFFKL